jgi:sporulation protein YlmC with PRC-barrel domain
MEEDMLKKHMAACLVTTALLAAPALAQTSSGTSSGSGASSAAASSGKFLSEEKPNQWRASKLVGVDVYGPNKEKVGDINEVLIDRNGKAEAIVIGVGGFLGIGEKDVAVPFDQVRWSDNPNDVRSTASTGGAGGTGATATGGAASNTAGTAGTAGGAGMAGGAGTSGSTTAGTGAGATTGSTGTAGAARTEASSANRGYPDHAMISMTKEELNSAPSFRYAGSTSRDNTGAAATRPAGTGAGTTAPAGSTAPAGGTAPRQ